MRVLISAESFLPEINGVTNSVLRVVEHLDRGGHDALVVATEPGPATIAGFAVERVPAVSLPRYPSLRIAYPGRDRLDEVFRTFEPDVAHLAAPVVQGAAVAAAARRHGVPTVASFQTDLSGFLSDYGLRCVTPAVWSWLRRVHGRADLTLAPSSATAFALRRHGIGPLAVWGRGVDGVRFSPDHRCAAVRSSLGAASDGDVLVGYVGRLASEKQVHVLAGLADLRSVRLVVVGDGPARRRLERQLPNADFLGFRGGTELAAIMASLDIFVHTGPHETFCQSLQEAMASGLPVVAPASGGPLDLVDHGRTGYLFPVGDRRLLRSVVESLAVDAGRREAMGAAARAAVEHRSWSVVGDELLGHLERVMAGSTAVAARAA